VLLFCLLLTMSLVNTHICTNVITIIAYLFRTKHNNVTMMKVGKIDITKQKCVLLVCDIQDGKLLSKILNQEKVRYDDDC